MRSTIRRLMAQTARTVPPIARLYDQRAMLAERVTFLESQVAALSTRPSQLYAQMANIEERRATGYLVEFDYPYKPRARNWEAGSNGALWHEMLAARRDEYTSLLHSFLHLRSIFDEIPNEESKNERLPFWSNSWFPVLDGICLGGLLAELNPRRYVEVGSGNSTKFARHVISALNLRTRIISIDPAPRAVIDTLCDEVIRSPLEYCDLGIFDSLGPEDVLFLDNSHRGFQNSDVTVFFTEVLPILGSGCYYGMHDIFLPNDYPSDWIARFYNEQYFLMAYLLGGARQDRIVLPVYYVQRTPELVEILEPIIRRPASCGTPAHGGAFGSGGHSGRRSLPESSPGRSDRGEQQCSFTLMRLRSATCAALPVQSAITTEGRGDRLPPRE